MNKLKPCPFCGGTQEIVTRDVEPQGDSWDAVLIDVDHSPDERLSTAHEAFYTTAGLRRVARHLRPGGLFALWSYDRSPLLQETMQQAGLLKKGSGEHYLPVPLVPSSGHVVGAWMRFELGEIACAAPE